MDKIGFKIQLEIIKQKLNYFTKATLKDATEEKLEETENGSDNQ